MEVEWVEELPADPSGYGPFLETLRERPGMWAKMTTVASFWNERIITPPGHQYEYASRGTTVYARYIGEEQ